jgi:hypothetical protein
MRNVDLIPADLTARREMNCQLRTWAIRLGVGAVTAALVYVGLCGLAEGRHNELLRLTGEYSSLQQRLQRAGDLLKERERLSQNREAIALIREGRTTVQLLGILEEALTPQSYLSYVRLERCPFQDPSPTTAEEQEHCSTRLTIRGLAPSHQEIGHIIRKLIVSQMFSDVALVSASDPADTDGDHKVEFEILCTLAGEGSTLGPERYGDLEAERIDE